MPFAETFRIPKHRRHVPAARQNVRKTLADWGLTGELADDVVVSANELVTNAVRHCRVTLAQVEVRLSVQGTVLVLEVSDPDRDATPRLDAPGLDEEGGRGLALLVQLADAWGYTKQPYSKRVWARFALTQGSRAPTCAEAHGHA
ncbi:ATP-binding protein [Streptomyces sp. MUM 16J]|uniref:ATP-binding protein n=1 Tax=Streptomyces sp. MUM 16J TaxID=2791988 RepID=UPI001F03B69D|nr:ATP-binding protein [Streptomyces sp. MUM 16J]MCH0559763.1 ATP-binding protein [Streptomyces sp. MUM 16J]